MDVVRPLSSKTSRRSDCVTPLEPEPLPRFADEFARKLATLMTDPNLHRVVGRPIKSAYRSVTCEDEGFAVSATANG